MGGKGEQRHQGGSGPLQCGHGGMVHRIFVIGNGSASAIGTQYDLRYTPGATSAGRKPMTTPKAKLAGLALIAALCAGFTLGLTAPAWAGLD